MTTHLITVTPVLPRLQTVLQDAPDAVRIGISVRHLMNGSQFGHNERLEFPAASTIKIVILVALARAVDEGQLTLDQRAPVLSSQAVGGSGVLNWLQRGLELSLRDHAWLMIAISDNTASNVLIDAVGLPRISATQRALGLETTALNRRFLGRLPNAGEPENIACAVDLTRVLDAIANGDASSRERCDWMLGLLAGRQHRDRIARHLPDGVTFAGKSGSLTRLTHDCGIISGPGGAAAIAVLTQGFDDNYAADAFIGQAAEAAVRDLGLHIVGGER